MPHGALPGEVNALKPRRTITIPTVTRIGESPDRLVAIGALALVAATAVIVVRHRDGSLAADPAGAANDVAVGAIMIAAGIVGWWRLPVNTTGPLLAATGFAWWLADLARIPGGVWWTAGHLLVGLYIALGVQAMIGFPSGTIRGPLEATTVAAAWVAMVLLQPAELLFRDPRAHGCVACGPNLLLVRDARDAYRAIDAGLNLAQIGVAAAVLLVLVRRWRSSTRTTRHVVGPVLAAVSAVAAIGLADSVVWLARREEGGAASRVFFFAAGLIPLALLVGLLRARLARGSVAELVVALGRDPAPGRLEDAIRHALRDPTCQIAFYLPAIAGYADADGRPTALPSADSERIVTELHHDGQPIAALVCDPALELNPKLLDSVATAARLAIENTRLQADLRVQLNHVRESRARIVEATDNARRRLEHDLHDGTQQHVVKALIDVEKARRALPDEPAASEQALSEVRDDLDQLLAALRSVARGLHPAILTDQGLAGALEWIAMRASVPVTLTRVPSTRLPARVETAAYYLCAEALTNAQKHAGASRVTIDAVLEHGTLRVVVVDDGTGGATIVPGGGLAGLRDRVEALDGTLALGPGPGGGTRVEAVIPCA